MDRSDSDRPPTVGKTGPEFDVTAEMIAAGVDELHCHYIGICESEPTAKETLKNSAPPILDHGKSIA
jgi:hypothetical protein